MFHTVICDLLGIRYPILQGAMQGGGDACGFLAAFALGAAGIQMGTRFMATTESDLNAWGRAQQFTRSRLPP